MAAPVGPLLGRKIRKTFGGEWYDGVVDGYVAEKGWYHGKLCFPVAHTERDINASISEHTTTYDFPYRVATMYRRFCTQINVKTISFVSLLHSF